MAFRPSYTIIENEEAYDAAIARRIQANSRKTAERTNWIGQNDHREIVAFLQKSKASDETFIGKMRDRYNDYWKLSDGQVNAVRKIINQKKERAAQFAANSTSTHQGEVGKRLTAKNVKVVAVVPLQGESFGYYTGTVFPQLTIMKDEAGNILKVKSASFKPAKGDTLDIVGSVKAHDTYNGEANTALQRVKVLRHDVFIPEVPACLDTDPATLMDEKAVQAVIDAGQDWRASIYKLNLKEDRKEELVESIKTKMVAFYGRLHEIELNGTPVSLVADFNRMAEIYNDIDDKSSLEKYRNYINGKLARFGQKLPE